MQAKLENLEKTNVKLTIETSPEMFEEGLAYAYKKNVKKYKVDGFRPGKVPRAILTKMYGEECLYDEAINYIIPRDYDAAVEELKLLVVSEPKFDIVTLEKEKFVFTAEVTLKPEVKLGQYEGVEIVEQSTEVTDEDIEAELKKTAEQNSRMVEVTDRPAEMGDTVNIDFTGYLDGEEFAGGKGENHPLELGSGSFIPGFEEQLVGTNAGDEKDVNVTFPEDYHAEDLKGKAVVFKCKVHDIKKKEIPAIDDDFASDVSEFDTLDEYKADIKAKLSERKATSAKNIMQNEAIEAATANAEVDVPDCMVENRVNNQIEDYRHRLGHSGVQLEQYLQYMGMTLEQMKEDLSKQAGKDVKEMLVLEAIAKDAKIEATDVEIDEEIEKMAKQYNMEAAEVKERLGEANLKNIAENIKIRKAIELITDKAVKVASKEEKPAKKTEEKTEE